MSLRYSPAMSTPPTPAGWYPDPDDSGSQRYWDGSAWTEHRAPVQAPSEPAVEQPTVVVPTRPASPEGRGGAHRKPDTEPVEPEPTEPEPGVTAPVAQWTPPPLEPEAQAFEPEPHAFEPEPPKFEQAPPSFEQAPPSFEQAPAFAAPLGGPSAPADNKKLIVWFSAACAGLLAVLILVVVYALFLHDPGTTQIASPTTAPTETATEEPTTETSAPGWGSEPTAPPTETQAPAGGESVDGPLAFTLTGVETGNTVTSTEAPVEKTAQGEYVVVRLTVHNTGEAPAQFLGTLQRLHAGGTTYNIDDEATFYVGGGFVEIPPGGEAVVGVAFDVPPGTVGEAIELHFDPLSPGIQLPL